MLLAVLWVKFKFWDHQFPGRRVREKQEEGKKFSRIRRNKEK